MGATTNIQMLQNSLKGLESFVTKVEEDPEDKGKLEQFEIQQDKEKSCSS